MASSPPDCGGGRRGLFACQFFFLGMLGATANVPAAAQPDALAERRAQIADILTRMPVDRVFSRRQMCAWGISGEMDAAVERAFDSSLAGRLAEECLATLTRLAREGRAEPIQDNRAPAALAVDAGFMAGFRQGGAVPADLPGMATLKPVAERCLRQREANTRLCSAAGFALGLRASHGEVVTAG